MDELIRINVELQTVVEYLNHELLKKELDRNELEELLSDLTSLEYQMYLVINKEVQKKWVNIKLCKLVQNVQSFVSYSQQHQLSNTK